MPSWFPGCITWGRCSASWSNRPSRSPLRLSDGRATITFAQTYWKMELNGDASDVIVPVVSWETPSNNWVLDRPARWSTKFTITNSDGIVSIITVFTNVPLMPDVHLRPLLDIEGDDEMVVIAGKPPEVVGV